MKTHARWMTALAVIAGAYLSSTANSVAAVSKEVAEAEAMMKTEDAKERAAAAARAKDPAWKPSCVQTGLIQVGDGKSPGTLKNFCLDGDGNILACIAVEDSSKSKGGSCIRVYSPKGELLRTLPLEIKPGAICMAKDGSIFVAGSGRVLKLDATGRVLASAQSPVANEPVIIGKDVEDMLKQSGRPIEAEKARMKLTLEKRRADVTGLATTAQDVFIVVGAPTNFSYRVYRLDQDLQNPKLVVEKLRGCCGQMDVQAHDGKLWIPHNSRHAIESRDRDGNELSKFGTEGKVKATDFGGCCEPKNMRVLANGDVLAAESGPPTCIKRFSSTGKFLGVVAVLDEKADCVRVTVEASPTGNAFYLLDTHHDAIRVFSPKG